MKVLGYSQILTGRFVNPSRLVNGFRGRQFDVIAVVRLVLLLLFLDFFVEQIPPEENLFLREAVLRVSQNVHVPLRLRFEFEVTDATAEVI